MEKSTRNTLQQMFWYFIIFSIIGLLLETLYCYATMGIIESRKGLIWGPFCPVYGIGAIVFLVALQHYKGGNVKLFFYGVLIGSIAEYVMSYMLEAVYGSRFWQYVENDIYGNRNQKLPEVTDVTVENIENIEYTIGTDFTDDNAYQVEVSIKYKEDMDYPTKATLTFVHEDNKLSLVEVE